MIQVFYWSSFMVLFFTWIGYISVLLLISRFASKRSMVGTTHPRVTVLVTVHNEEKNVRNRIENILASDYPSQCLEILVASDGSIDGTNAVVEQMTKQDDRITLFTTPGGGKSATQNKAIAVTKGEIIVLTDADTMFEKDTIKSLVGNFSNEQVGCVSGTVVLTAFGNAVSQGQGLYWQYEMVMRKLESDIGIFHTATGAVMAFRKSLFRAFCPEHGDDCIIPLDILSQGYRVVHEKSAIAYDAFASTMKGELRARTRMTLRNITCTLGRYALLNPVKYPGLCPAIFFHKIFRWLTPYFMILLYCSNILLLDRGNWFWLSFYAQSLFYALGVLGFISEWRGRRIPIASQIFSFLLANVGFFLGVVKAAMGSKIAAYQQNNGRGV